MTRLPTNSLERALFILEFIGNTPGGMTNVEISREFNIARSTCTYILSRLERKGYLARDKVNGKYRLGLKVVALGRGALREIGFRDASEPSLYRLAAETGLAANLAVLEGERVLVLDRIEGPAFIKAAIEESSPSSDVEVKRRSTRVYREFRFELPVFSTALGKVLLAYLPGEELNAFFREFQSAKKLLKDDRARNELIAELTKVREQGYCYMSFEPYSESCALAAPIFDGRGNMRAAVSVSCKRHLAIWKDELALSKIVKEGALEISGKLHYQNAIHPGGENYKGLNGIDETDKIGAIQVGVY